MASIGREKVLLLSRFFQGAQQQVGHIGDGFGGAEVYLSTAELVDGLGQQLGYVGGSLQGDGVETGRHGDCVSLTAAGFAAFFAGLGLFVLLIGVVEETAGLAGLDICVAAGTNFADVLATGFSVENICGFHSRHPPWMPEIMMAWIDVDCSDTISE